MHAEVLDEQCVGVLRNVGCILWQELQKECHLALAHRLDEESFIVADKKHRAALSWGRQLSQRLVACNSCRTHLLHCSPVCCNVVLLCISMSLVTSAPGTSTLVACTCSKQVDANDSSTCPADYDERDASHHCHRSMIVNVIVLHRRVATVTSVVLKTRVTSLMIDTRVVVVVAIKASILFEGN